DPQGGESCGVGLSILGDCKVTTTRRRNIASKFAIAIFSLTLAATPALAGKNKAQKNKEAKGADASETRGCWPVVGGAFSDDGYSVAVESGKDLSNVVLLFSDGTTQRFEGLDDNDATFAGTDEHTGKTLTGVWIKSGCNHSGDGPGYGEFVENSENTTELPVISISDSPAVVEMGLGMISEAVFTITLSEMVPLDSQPVTVRLNTIDGTAVAGEDYIPDEMILTFYPGQISIDYAILIVGDFEMESQEENYFVELSEPMHAVLGQPVGTGWIFDDDDTDF
ncbi:MAG: hypothetical protein KJO55_08535, partial [Gammaproteobacteria bacterium]|nr:hypothetical protein [Gammaproteobacteria bacterium]